MIGLLHRYQAVGTVPFSGSRHKLDAGLPRELLALAVVAAVIAVAIALVLPDITAAGRMTTSPTHYLGLLLSNQPWNLLLFMVEPFVLIYGGLVPAKLGLVSPSGGRLITPVLAAYHTATSVYLIRYVAWPLTTSAGWRGPADWIAVIDYIATAVPILGLTVAAFTATTDRARNWWFYSVVVLAGRARPHRDELRVARPVRARLGRPWPRHGWEVSAKAVKIQAAGLASPLSGTGGELFQVRSPLTGSDWLAMVSGHANQAVAGRASYSF